MRNGDYLCLNFAVSGVCYHKVFLFFLMVMWVGGNLLILVLDGVLSLQHKGNKGIGSCGLDLELKNMYSSFVVS